MIPYWLLFLMPAWFAVTQPWPAPSRTELSVRSWSAMYVILVLMIGLRHEVGGDWDTYADFIYEAGYKSLREIFSIEDPAYGLLNWIAANTEMGPYFVNTVCAVIFSWGLVMFCRAQPLPWLALVVAVPYLVTVVAMGYTRQGTAIGLAMLGFVALSENKILRFVVFVTLAALFHKSAVILMPLGILWTGRRDKIRTILLVGAAAALSYTLLLQESVERLRINYIEAEYQSEGAAIRVAMNVVPAVLFLLFRAKFVMPPAERKFWTWISLAALAFVGWLMVSPSSTAVDRVALYCIPLQLMVLSRLPVTFDNPGGVNVVLVYGVVAYSAAVLFVWLFYAQTAFAWLPYQFYPWVALWGN